MDKENTTQQVFLTSLAVLNCASIITNIICKYRNVSVWVDCVLELANVLYVLIVGALCMRNFGKGVLEIQQHFQKKIKELMYRKVVFEKQIVCSFKSVFEIINGEEICGYK